MRRTREIGGMFMRPGGILANRGRRFWGFLSAVGIVASSLPIKEGEKGSGLLQLRFGVGMEVRNILT